jgi:hypothetical protein
MWDWVIWCAMPVVLTASSTVYMGAHRSRAVRKMMEGVLAEDDRCVLMVMLMRM